MGASGVEGDWSPVWAEVAETLASHWGAGRGHLLTRDAMRLSAVVALDQLGVDPSRVTADVPAPLLADGVADLVVDGLDGAVVELRHPHGTAAPRPAALPMGELLRDVMRLACLPARRRWVVQVLSTGTMRHLEAAASRYSLVWPTEPGRRLVVEAGTLEWLPSAAQEVVGRAAWQFPSVATCTDVLPVHGELALHVFAVETPGAAPLPEPEESVASLGATGGAPRSRAGESPAGSARAEILDAVRAVLARTGASTFAVEDVVAELRGRGSRFVEPTVRTMLTSHMCADVRGRGIAAYDDVERVGPGSYRLLPGR